MIPVTRLNGTKVIINALLIESVEEAADTVISLTTGNKLVVKEKADDIIRLSSQYLGTIGLINANHKLDRLEGPAS